MADDDRVLVFLGGDNADALAFFEAIDQRVVGVNIELLLHLALDVYLVGGAENIDERRPADLRLDHLGGQDQAGHQPLQLGMRALDMRLLLDDVLLECGWHIVSGPRVSGRPSGRA